jgi:glycosyltransferase involved in cell wall biosynthesis
MRVLIVCARWPDAHGKGDQQRALQLAQLLSREHEVRLITTGKPPLHAGAATPGAVPNTVRIRLSPVERAAGAIQALLIGLPVQVGWMMPRRAYRAVALATQHSDVVIAVTIRCLRAPLPAPTVLDHVDALSANMRQRARLERRGFARFAARLEASRLARHELRAASWVRSQLVVSPIDAASLPQQPAPQVIPLVLKLPAIDPAAAREIDVVFTGDMRYPPNRDAAEWLCAEIVPALRELRGPTRVVVAGRAAAILDASSGVEVMSDAPDLGTVLRQARVAAVPLRMGTGTPIKVHEAAAAGAAVVATPWVADALGADVDTATDAPGFAAAIARLLGDEALRRDRVAATRASLERSSPAAVASGLAEVLKLVNVV